MAPPTNDELNARRQMMRQALAGLDPQGTTPPVLRDLIIELGARHRQTGGAILQAAMAPPPQVIQPQPAQGQQGQAQQGQAQQGQAQPAQGQGRGQGAGGQGQQSASSSTTGSGRGAGAPASSGRGGGSSGQQ